VPHLWVSADLREGCPHGGAILWWPRLHRPAGVPDLPLSGTSGTRTVAGLHERGRRARRRAEDSPTETRTTKRSRSVTAKETLAPAIANDLTGRGESPSRNRRLITPIIGHSPGRKSRSLPPLHPKVTIPARRCLKRCPLDLALLRRDLGRGRLTVPRERFRSVIRRKVTMLVALADKLNTASRRATLQPPLA